MPISVRPIPRAMMQGRADDEAAALENKLNEPGNLGTLVHLIPSVYDDRYLLAIFQAP